MRRLLPLTMILAAGLVSFGCGSFSKPDLEKNRFALEVRRPRRVPARGERRLLVPAFHVDAAFAGRGFVYRSAPGEYRTDFYNEFFAPPGDMIAALTRRWLAGSGLFASVSAGGSRESVTEILEADVTALYGDYTETRGQAVFEIRVTRLGGEGMQLLGQKEYAFEEPLEDDEPSTLAAGWSACLGRFLAALEEDLRRGGEEAPASGS